MSPSLVVTSPVSRARDTALAVASATNAVLEVDQDLADREYGGWAGHNEAEVVARFGSLDAAPGVKPAEAFSIRIRGRHVPTCPGSPRRR
jgi:broad specificity phosphatase PhoE